MEHYNFMSNEACEYFPCHKGVEVGEFNCLFCYCPLYALGEDCGGNFTYTREGIKDCSGCLIPHQAGSYEYIAARCGELVERMRRPQGERTEEK